MSVGTGVIEVIDARQAAVGAVEVVTSRGQLRVTHTVTNEEHRVLGQAVRHALLTFRSVLRKVARLGGADRTVSVDNRNHVTRRSRLGEVGIGSRVALVRVQIQGVQNRVEKIGLVGLTKHVLLAWSVGGHAQLGTGVLLRTGVGAVLGHRGGAVGNRHRGLLVRGEQARGGRNVVAVISHDLRGVRVISGDDDERVAVTLGEIKGFLDGFVQALGLTNLAASIRAVITLINRSGLNLQEEALIRGRIIEELNGLAGHQRHLRLGANILRLAGNRGLLGGPELRRRGGEGRLHIAGREQAENRRILVGFLNCRKLVGGGNNLVAVVLGVLEDRLTRNPGGRVLRVTLEERVGVAGVNLDLSIKVRSTAAKGYIGAGVNDLLRNRTQTAVLASVGRFHNLLVTRGCVGGTLGHVGAQDCRGGVLDLRRGHVTGTQTGILRLFNQVDLGGALQTHTNCAVVRLRSGGPGGTRRR